MHVGLRGGGLGQRARAHEVRDRVVEQLLGRRSCRERHEQRPDGEHEAEPAAREQTDRTHEAVVGQEIEAGLRDGEAQGIAAP